jgi:hypothetical protein
MMDESAVATRKRITNENHSTLSREEPGLRLILLNEIWKGFLEYCEQNELDPVQQIREAATSYYQDLLKTYRIRKKLDSSDEPERV